MAVPKKTKLEKDTGNNTQPSPDSTSTQQHKALGARKMSGPSSGGHTTQEPENKLVAVPTSPQADSSLPNITNGNGTIDTGVVVEDTPSPTPSPGETPFFPAATDDRERETLGKYKPTYTGETYEEGQPRSLANPSIIWWLGGGLIIANFIVGGSFSTLTKKVWAKPEGQGPDVKSVQKLLVEVGGSVFFLIILATIARINPNLNRPIVVFLIGVWAVWIIFTIPIIQKQGLGGTAIGQLLGMQQDTSSGKPTTQGHAPGKGPTKSHGGSYEDGYQGITYHKTYNNIIGV